MFVFPLLKFSRFSQMNAHCPHCHFRFEVEPGFFIGAMYVSYAMSLAIFMVVGFLVYLVFDNPDFYYYIIAIPIMVLILLPFMYRYSRVLFLYGFGGVKYEDEQTNSRLRL
ncbi:MAG: DUF983 domain-containing protein [Cyclobacteriaceae bacterium]|nr:DUF983 domain-containing protein [Cyclobacteriaceae bacterium]